MTPTWLAHARRYEGVTEIPGAPTAPKIAAWLKLLKAWWADDETPWCGVFCAAVMRECSIPVPAAWYRAKAWLEWGTRAAIPSAGCVVIFDRQGGGHVAIVVGQDGKGRLMCIGGNQGNRVSIAPFDRSRVLGYRWPPGEPFPPIQVLPVMSASGASSSNEA